MKNERIIKNYFSGWEKTDWNTVESFLADGFTFTSPNDDDHINKRRYKEKCWPEAERIERIKVDKVIENGDEAFARYQCFTKDDGLIRNTEYFKFENGKIKEIEVFFGTPKGYPSAAE